MWIKGWSIDAFGHLHNTGTKDLAKGLNVVLGPNESGKTTTLHFIRWVLFGFPPANTNVFRHYKPASGAFGGRVRIGQGDRFIGVERHHGDPLPTLTSPDGSVLTNTMWSDVVGAAGPELFESVFAITTSELQSIGELNTNEVREQIYAAGTVGHGRSARAVLEELEQANNRLLSRRKGRLRELHHDLALRNEELTDAIERAKGLDRRWDEVTALLDEVGGCDRRRQQLDATRVHLEKLIASWRSWVEGATAQRELDEMAPRVDLPPEPTAALTAASDEVERLEQSRNSAEKALRNTEAGIDAIQVDDRLMRVATEARRLDRLAPTMTDRDRQLSAKQAELDLLHNDAVERLTTLGSGWTAEALTNIDVSPRTSQDAGDRAGALSGTRARRKNAEDELDLAAGSHDEVLAQVAAAEANLADAKSQLPGISDTAGARSAVLNLQGLVPRLEQAEARAADAEHYERLTRHLESGTPSAFVPPIVLPVLIVVAVLCVIGAGASLLTNSVVGGVALLLVAIGLVVLADVVRTATRIPDDGPTQAGTTTSSSPPESDEQAQLSDLASAVDSSARRAGFDHRPTTHALNDRLIALDRQQSLDGELKALKARLTQSSVELEAAKARERQARDSLAAETERWESWRTSHGLPDGLASEVAVAFLERVRITRDAIRNEERVSAEIEVLDRELTSWREEVRDLLNNAGFDPEGGIAGLALCCDAITNEERQGERRDELLGEIPAMRERLDASDEELQLAGERLAALLARARADTSDEYLVAVNTEVRRIELQNRAEELQVELAGRFGNENAVLTARSELANGDLSEWEQNLRETELQLVDAESRYDDAVRTHQDALRQVQELERSADVAVLSLDVEALRSELDDAIGDWTITTLAHRGVDSTLRRFETERQPEVVRTAADAFRRITNGRYTGLVPEDGTLRVIMPDGGSVDASKLSRGTTEQLYLAMRFGLARQYAHSTPLPLVLDDVLANADPERRRALAEELLVVAADLQVILFTCHPATADLLADTATAHNIAERANVVRMPH